MPSVCCSHSEKFADLVDYMLPREDEASLTQRLYFIC